MIVFLGVPLLKLLKDPGNPRRFLPASMFPFFAGGAAGIFLAVASHSMQWSGTTLFVIGCAQVSVISFLGVPLILLPLETPAAPEHGPVSLDI